MSVMNTKQIREAFQNLTGFPLVKCNAVVFVADIGDLRKRDNLLLVLEAAKQTIPHVATYTEVCDCENERKQIAQLRKELETARKTTITESSTSEADRKLIEKLRNDVAQIKHSEQHARNRVSDLEKRIAILNSENDTLRDRLRKAEVELSKKVQTVTDANTEEINHVNVTIRVGMSNDVTDKEVADASIFFVEDEQETVEEMFTTYLKKSTDVKKTYKNLAMLLHPDTAKYPRHLAEKAFKLLNEINNNLKDKSNGFNSIYEEFIRKYRTHTTQDENISDFL